jgi:hypothetical protein
MVQESVSARRGSDALTVLAFLQGALTAWLGDRKMDAVDEARESAVGRAVPRLDPVAGNGSSRAPRDRPGRTAVPA